MPPVLPEGVKVYENVVYTHFNKTPFGPRDLHVDIFRPDNDSIYPALLMIHGADGTQATVRCRCRWPSR